MFILVVSYCFLSLLFLAIKVFFPPLSFPSLFFSFLSPCCKGPTSLCFSSFQPIVACSFPFASPCYCLLHPFCFGLLLPIPSLVLHLVVVCYLFHDWPNILLLITCLLPPSRLALLLLVPSFMLSPIAAKNILLI